MRTRAMPGRSEVASNVLVALLTATALLAASVPGQAQDATWSANPGSGDFNTTGNWSPSVVPTGTAFFGTSSVTNLSISTATTIGAWAFNAGASAYAFTNHQTLTFTGGGLTIHGGSVAIVNDNTLTFSNSSTAANATITTNSGATTTFLDTASGGAARFMVNTGGLLDIAGATAPVTAGSIEGNGHIDLGANGLIVGGNNRSTVFGGVIDGTNFSALTKVGSGTLTLTGTNTYLGDTNVNGGTLLVNGWIANSGSVIVNPGATLGGTGTVPFTLLDDGATLAPGTPTALGTLTVNDRLMFCACSIFSVKVTSQDSDRVVVLAPSLAGDAFLGGEVRVSSLNGTYRLNVPYTILATIGGINGTAFDKLTLPNGLSGTLGYTPNDVTLTLASALGQTPGLGGNQQRIANVLDTAFNSGGSTGALGGVFGGDVNARLAQLSGQPAGGLAPAGIQMTGSFLSTMLHPAGGPGGNTSSPSGALGYAAEPRVLSDAAAAYAAVTPKDRRAIYLPAEPRWSVWGQFYGGQRTTAGDAMSGTADTTARTYGVATGFDYRVSADTAVGFALAGGATNYGLADGLGSGKSDVFQLGLNGTRTFGAAYVAAALSYAWHEASTDRTVTLAGADRLTADFGAHSFGGRLEGGYRINAAMFGLTPYAAVQVQAFRTPSYGETALAGSNAFALSYDARTVNATRTELGAWFDRVVALERGSMLVLRGRAAWAHDYNNDQTISAAFQTLPGASFIVSSAQAGADAAVLSAGAELRLRNNWSVAAKFDSEFASAARTYAGTGTLRYAW